VRGRTDAGIGHVDLVLVGLHIGEQFLEVLGREVLARDQGHRTVVDQADRIEVANRIIGQLPVERRSRGMADMVHKERVAVRLCLGQTGRAERSSCAAHILHNELGLENGTHGLCRQTGDRVRRSACGKGNDDGDHF